MMAAAVTVLFFGAAREITGIEAEDYSASDTAELRGQILKRYPGLGKISFRMAQNRVLLKEDTELKGNDIIAILPPFEGG
jgi:molybdopterin converting factor small subunit